MWCRWFSPEERQHGSHEGAAIIFASYAALCGLYSWHDFQQKNRYGRFFLKQLFLKTGILWFSLYTFDSLYKFMLESYPYFVGLPSSRMYGHAVA